MFKNPNTRSRNLILLILPFVLMIGVFGFFGYKSIASIASQIKTEDEEVYYIESMNYKLRSNATDYQIELFNKLDKAVEDGTDDLKIAELVAENFVADFYTWTNKKGTYDVGGIYYVYTPHKQSISLDARMHFYKYLTYYIDTYGSESLLEVNNIEVTDSYIGDELYEVDGKSYKAFYITCTWDYNDFSFGPNGNLKEDEHFMNKGYFVVIKNNDGRFEIVGAYGDE